MTVSFSQMSSDVRSIAGILPVSNEPVEVSIGSISDESAPPVLLRGGAVRVDVPLDPPVGLRRIAAVVPCFNRADDARLLLSDLQQLDLRGIDLRVLLVDNASETPLGELGLTLDGPEPAVGPRRLSHVRLSRNTGGSGGFNFGLDVVLGTHPLQRDAWSPEWKAFDPQWVWLIDSDARVEPQTLRALLDVMAADERVVAAGPAICDPKTGVAFELGGRMNARTGIMEPIVAGSAGVVGPVESEYLAACCVLIRADAARCAGPMPDTFLNADDAEWFIRMRRRTGGLVLALPHVRAMHPRFDRFPTWTRYYATRNAHGPLAALGVGRMAHARRALRDVVRAAQQELMERSDLARLHLLGLRDAGQRGPAPAGLINVQPARPVRALLTDLEREVGSLREVRIGIHPESGLSASDRHALELALVHAGAAVSELAERASPWHVLQRLLRGPAAEVAIVPARGRPTSWWRGRVQVQVADGQFSLTRPGRVRSLARAATTLARGSWRSMRLARAASAGALDAPSAFDPAYRAAHAHAGEALSVEVIVLSHNRWPALEHTVRRLLDAPWMHGSRGGTCSITIVDNASTDGTGVRAEDLLAPLGARVIRMPENLGVDAFNHAVLLSKADVVIILDDDAVPEDDAVVVALDELARRPDLSAVTLHPRHPKGGKSEWPFAASLHGAASDRWPVMGCANIVRRSAWTLVGGYEKSMFLYRNDTDLALKLLGAGLGVRFDPALVVWHDSPAAAGGRKSERWHELATRNWIWMARRHGSGLDALIGGMLGWLWAHALAHASVARHAATLRGAWRGLREPAPAMPAACASDGWAWRSLLRLRFTRRPASK